MNRFSGSIAELDIAGSVLLLVVAVGAQRYTAIMVGSQDEFQGWRRGMPVTLLFKETEVSLAKELSGMISMRNRMPGCIAAIERGRLLTRVRFDVDGTAIESVITTRSCDAMRLTVGDAVEGLVKSNEMHVEPAP